MVTNHKEECMGNRDQHPARGSMMQQKIMTPQDFQKFCQLVAKVPAADLRQNERELLLLINQISPQIIEIKQLLVGVSRI